MKTELIYKHTATLSPIPTDIPPRGQLKIPVKCILFDIYGTLFISATGDISTAQNLTLQSEKLYELFDRFNIKASPDNIKNNLFNAIRVEHQEFKSKGVDYPEVKIEKIWASVLNIESDDTLRSFAIEYEMIVNPVYPMPNLQKVLSFFDENSIAMGLISNAQFYTPMLFQCFLRKDLSALGFLKELIFFSYKFSCAKPSMKLFGLASDALEKMKIKPDEVLYVGNDMLNDIYPAVKTGFKTALFAGDKRSLRLRKEDERCININPDLIITDLIQLKKLVTS